MWSLEVEIEPYTMSKRIKHGWSIEDALTKPVRAKT